MLNLKIRIEVLLCNHHVETRNGRLHIQFTFRSDSHRHFHPGVISGVQEQDHRAGRRVDELQRHVRVDRQVVLRVAVQYQVGNHAVD